MTSPPGTESDAVSLHWFVPHSLLLRFRGRQITRGMEKCVSTRISSTCALHHRNSRHAGIGLNCFRHSGDYSCNAKTTDIFHGDRPQEQTIAVLAPKEVALYPFSAVMPFAFPRRDSCDDPRRELPGCPWDETEITVVCALLVLLLRESIAF